jgi:ComF family protein
MLDLCVTCDRGLPYAAGRTGVANSRYLDEVLAALDYVFPVDELVHTLKYRGDPAVARVFARLMVRRWAKRVAARSRERPQLPELLVPVPLHVARRRERGFNQAALIARHIGRELGVPSAPQCVERLLATRTQTTLSIAERRDNVRRAFRVAQGRAARALASVRHVAIIDDVVTTGSTADELARVLRGAGVRRVDLWVVARALPPSVSADAKRVFEHDADEDSHANIVVVQERSKAGVGVSFADQPLLIDEEHAGAHQPRLIPSAKLHAGTSQVQRE